jgi:hypothetical protein
MLPEVSVLPALPPYGEAATTFSATGQGGHSEGLVVSFRANRATWIGNFCRGLTEFDLAVVHPNGTTALIIAGGQGYLIDSSTRHLKGIFGGAIVDAFPHPTIAAIVLNRQNISFEAIGESGRLWNSRRVSWDGLRFIKITGDTIIGEAWRPDDTWHSFRVNLASGEVQGGSYEEGTAQ